MSTAAVTTEAAVPAAAAAVETVETPEISVQERLNHASSAELDNWRKTGDIPPVKVKAAENASGEKKNEPSNSARTGAPATPSQDKASQEKDKGKGKSAEPGASPAPAADAAAAQPANQPQRRKKSDERFEKLLDAWEKDRQELARLRSQPSGNNADKQNSQPAAEDKTAKPGASTAAAPAKPKLTDTDPKTGKQFASLDAWMEAVDEWTDKRLEARLEERLGKVEQARTQTEEQRQVAEAVITKSKPAMEKYKDFMEVAADPKLPIPAGSPVDLFIKDSDNPGEVLYYLGKHPEILAEFYGCDYDPETKTWDYGDFDHKTGKYTNHVNPIRQVRRLEAIEREFSAAPAPKKTPAAEARPVNPPPPKLPPPPPELGGRGAAPADEAEAALARGDMAAYMRIVNARETKAAQR
jgi:hypothetical protein